METDNPLNHAKPTWTGRGGENEALSSAIKRAAGCWRALPQGEQAAIIGRIKAGRAEVVLETELGGERILPELEDDPLPRIC